MLGSHTKKGNTGWKCQEMAQYVTEKWNNCNETTYFSPIFLIILHMIMPSFVIM
jgi:hypothetical protein